MDLAATVLTLGRVRLEPFEERHRAGLTAAAPLGWEIVDGKLYTNYHDGAVGAEYQWIIVPEAYYLRVDRSPVLTNCEWVLASSQ